MQSIQTDLLTRAPIDVLYGMGTSPEFVRHVLNSNMLIEVSDHRFVSRNQFEFFWSYQVGAIVMDGSFRLSGTIQGQRVMYEINGPLAATVRLDLRPIKAGSAVILTTCYTLSAGLLVLMTSPFIRSQLNYSHEAALLELKVLAEQPDSRIGAA